MRFQASLTDADYECFGSHQAKFRPPQNCFQAQADQLKTLLEKDLFAWPKARRAAALVFLAPLLDAMGVALGREPEAVRFNAFLAKLGKVSDGLVGRSIRVFRQRPDRFKEVLLGQTSTLLQIRSAKAVRPQFTFDGPPEPMPLVDWLRQLKMRFQLILLDLAAWEPDAAQVVGIARKIHIEGYVGLFPPERSVPTACLARFLAWQEDEAKILKSQGFYFRFHDNLCCRIVDWGKCCLLYSRPKDGKAWLREVLLAKKKREGQSAAPLTEVVGDFQALHRRCARREDALQAMFRCPALLSRRQRVLALSGDEQFLQDVFEAARLADLKVSLALVAPGHGRPVSRPDSVKPSSTVG